jgi:hypothetical protein
MTETKTNFEPEVRSSSRTGTTVMPTRSITRKAVMTSTAIAELETTQIARTLSPAKCKAKGRRASRTTVALSPRRVPIRIAS